MEEQEVESCPDPDPDPDQCAGSDHGDESDNSSSSEDNSEEVESMQGDFYSIRSQCLAENILYEDPYFPAHDFSIYRSTPRNCNEPVLRWKRPYEIASENNWDCYPKFVTQGYSRFDIRQGQLGNCWFLASCAALTSQPELFERVVPPDNGNFEEGEYAGVFHFYFCKNGQWIEIIVDDRLPVDNYNRLFFSSSFTKNEFWIALLEKAYAKLHGSYKALAGGTGRAGMLDLTGGTAEYYKLKDYDRESLFEVIEAHLERKSLITAGILSGDREYLKKLGLVKRHEYSVTKVARLDSTDFYDESEPDVMLICVRNPWGSCEWRGPWSDYSNDWGKVKEEKKEELHTLREDGEFWIHFEYFVYFFDGITFCQFPWDTWNEGQCYEEPELPE